MPKPITLDLAGRVAERAASARAALMEVADLLAGTDYDHWADLRGQAWSAADMAQRIADRARGWQQMLEEREAQHGASADDA